MKLELKFYGDPVLRQKAESINEINEEIKQLAKDLIETMYEENGIGLAAPQVGISKKMIAVDAGEHRGNPIVIMNPELIASEGKEVMEEGCLSFPEIYGKIERAKTAVFKGLTIEGKEIELHLKDLECRAFLHELDHLNGILFIDRMTPTHKIVIGSKLRKLKKETLKNLK